MPFRITCPGCQAVYRVPDDYVGKKLTCKKCRKPFAVGNPKPAEPPSGSAIAPGRTTTDFPPPKRVLVPAEQPPSVAAPNRKMSPLMIGAGIAALLVVGLAVAGGTFAAIYYLKRTPPPPVAQGATPSANPEAAAPAKAANQPVTEGKEKQVVSKPAATPKKTPREPNPAPRPTDPPASPAPQLALDTSQLSASAMTPGSETVHAHPLRIKIPNERLAKYEPESKRWVYAFYSGVTATNGLFYIDVLPSGVPTRRDAFAEKLREKDFFDKGKQFSEISEKDDLPDGFFIKGAVKNASRPKPEFGFVIVRRINGAYLRCRSGTVADRPVKDDELQKTMLDVFKQVTIRTTPLISLPPPSGAVLLRDNVTLVVAEADTAHLIYFDTLLGREIKRIEMDFQPAELVVQGDTIYAAAKGSALTYAVDAATGKVKKEYNLGGEGIIHLACHPRQGLIYASTTKFGVMSLEPVSGAVGKPKVIGQFLAVSPDGRYLYAGVQPPHVEEIDIIRQQDGTLLFLSDMWGPRGMMIKYAVEGTKLRFVSGQNNAAVNGRWMHLTPDGKRLLMVGGGGWRPPKEGGTGGGYITAIFSTDDLKTKVQTLQFTGLNTIFHPVLNLGVANSYGLFLTVFNSKSLIKREEIRLSPEREARPLLLMFAAKGRKLVLWNGDNIQKEQGLHFIPLRLKPEEEALLAKAYGPP